MLTLLFKKEIRNDVGKLLDFREVNCRFNKNGAFYIMCCDIGKVVREFYGDSGVEFSLTLKPVMVYKLCSKLQVDMKDLPSALISAVQEKFNNEDSFDDFKSFCELNGINYEFATW